MEYKVLTAENYRGIYDNIIVNLLFEGNIPCRIYIGMPVKCKSIAALFVGRYLSRIEFNSHQ
jgi:hypothetical protein